MDFVAVNSALYGRVRCVGRQYGRQKHRSEDTRKHNRSAQSYHVHVPDHQFRAFHSTLATMDTYPFKVSMLPYSRLVNPQRVCASYWHNYGFVRTSVSAGRFTESSRLRAFMYALADATMM